jgi:hypothetical protein
MQATNWAVLSFGTVELASSSVQKVWASGSSAMRRVEQVERPTSARISV